MPVFDEVCTEARKAPEKTAVAIGSVTISYKTLFRRVQNLRYALMQLPHSGSVRLGIPPQGRLLAVSLGNHIRFPEIFVAAGSAPNCIAVLDPNMPPIQLEEILQRLMPDLVVTDRQTSPVFRMAMQYGLKVVCTDEQQNMDFFYEGWLASAGGESDLPPVADPQGPFLIGFTSGSTTQPKAFIRNRQSWVKSLEYGRQVFMLDREMTTLAPGPLAHGVSLYALAETLDAGATFMTLPAFDAAGVLALLKNGIKRLVIVPAMIGMLKKQLGSHGAVFPALSQLVAGAAKFEHRHFMTAQRMFPNADIWQYYGASELGFVALDKVLNNTAAEDRGAVRIGCMFPSVKVTIRDFDGREVPAGNSGTVYVESDLVATGYLWGDDGISFRRTVYGATVGDIGFVDTNGKLSLISRAGGMIVSGGNNIYLSEIEAVLKKVPGIEEAVAFGLKDDDLGEKLVAVLSLHTDTKLKKREIFAFCADYLPKYKIPKNFYTINGWPMTTSGKIARGRVEKMIWAGNDALEALDGA